MVGASIVAGASLRSAAWARYTNGRSMSRRCRALAGSQPVPLDLFPRALMTALHHKTFTSDRPRTLRRSCASSRVIFFPGDLAN